MSLDTVPVFVVGSGRSGTRMIYRLLSGLDNIEIYHEYVCTHIQPISAKYFMNIINKEQVKELLRMLHGSAIYYSEAKYWIDCSNKLSWIIEPLYELFPKAKFLNLIRDGRKVANSFFHKLNDEMYDDNSVMVMQEWLKERKKLPCPPPEKKYWWNIPQKNQPFYEEFHKFNQFQRCCYQWREANRIIIESLKSIPTNQQLTIKLEDLISNKDVLISFLDFLDVEYSDNYFEFLQTPQNVIFPMDFDLTVDQIAQFNEIAFDMLQKLGYEEKEIYSVKY